MTHVFAIIKQIPVWPTSSKVTLSSVPGRGVLSQPQPAASLLPCDAVRWLSPWLSLPFRAFYMCSKSDIKYLFNITVLVLPVPVPQLKCEVFSNSLRWKKTGQSNIPKPEDVEQLSSLRWGSWGRKKTRYSTNSWAQCTVSFLGGVGMPERSPGSTNYCSGKYSSCINWILIHPHTEGHIERVLSRPSESAIKIVRLTKDCHKNE